MITLEEIEKLLKPEGFPCLILDEDETRPFPQLTVHMGLDPKEREVMLAITVIDQLLGSPDMLPTHQVVTCSYLFPFPVLHQAGSDMARLVAMLNTSLELPALQFNEVEQQLSYRAALLSNGESLDVPLVVGALGTIARTVDLYTETLEGVASGSQTFLELLEEQMRELEAISS